MTKSEAIQQCTNDGARLPVPKSDEENEFFFNLQVGSFNSYGGWIGVNDKEQEGLWVTDNGEQLNWFSWAPNEHPGGISSGGTIENAATLANINGLGWYDVNAAQKEVTICVRSKRES